MNFKLYGLLHLDDREQTAMNVRTNDFKDQIELYVKNALTLSKSLQIQGIEFILLTNQRLFIDEILLKLSESLMVEEISFQTQVPKGIRFYSAHFKLDVYRYFSQKDDDDYMGLCDLDMVCVNNIPQAFINNVKDKIPFFYDISEDVITTHGSEIIIRDLELLTGHRSEGRWSGGEFISGTAEFFAQLIYEIDELFPNYLNNLNIFHHIGDEALTSAGLENLRKSGTYIADAGTLGLVGRYWNTNVLYYQRKFYYFESCFLLHLPADKRFLADMHNKKLNNSHDYINHYKAYKNSTMGIIKRYLKKIKFYLVKIK
ncbi:MAG TPA: hypothetical protein EYG73_01950 [Arcobacter sp.]|nr:hypothetical protein [Arcobacter sp.]